MAVKYRRKVQRLNAGNNTSLKTVVLTLPGAQVVATGKIGFRVPEAGTYVGAAATLGTVNTGATFIIDVNKGGTTLYTTQARRPTIAISAANKTSTESGVPDGAVALAVGDIITVDVDQVGSTVAGSDLSVAISYLANDI